MAKWRRGQSGNPRGKIPGTLSRSTQLLNAMAAEDGRSVLRALLRKAKAGDVAACQTVLARLWPPRKGQLIKFTMPPMETAADLPRALAAITSAVSEGILSTAEAAEIAQLLAVQVRAYELQDVMQRLEALEARANAATDHR
jgi:hypothetical protein